jgi:hypothetical protein
MSFFINQDEVQKNHYIKLLQSVGSLSRLFSENAEPYLYYRLAENIFCKSFEADNLSRSDTSADASKGTIGIGLKTYLQNKNYKREKVAEFNSESKRLRKIEPEALVFEVARLRNKRIETTKNIYGLSEVIYHCVTRANAKMQVHEYEMPLINLGEIKIEKIGESGVYFHDDKEEYSYNFSKSTLFKKFTPDPILEIPIDIYAEPYDILENLFNNKTSNQLYQVTNQTIYLPLYSTRDKTKKEVADKSGLNQWNANGRPRHPDEIYIPIPALVRNHFPNFFPPRDAIFTLTLPNKQTLSASVCQEDSKALMSNPNGALGKWLLRDVLKLKTNELLTYQKLSEIGIDSIALEKLNSEHYKINFAKLGSYEKFSESINN